MAAVGLVMASRPAVTSTTLMTIVGPPAMRLLTEYLMSGAISRHDKAPKIVQASSNRDANVESGLTATCSAGTRVTVAVSMKNQTVIQTTAATTAKDQLTYPLSAASNAASVPPAVVRDTTNDWTRPCRPTCALQAGHVINEYRVMRHSE